MKKNNDITINANAIINLVKASSKLRIAMILIAFSFLFISTAKSQCSISVHKDANDFESSSNLGTATSLWVNVHFHLSNGDLTTNGDYVLFSGGTFTASIKSPVIANVSIPDGEVIADNTVSSPVTIYNGTMWITRVPLNYSNRDIFISGGIINSSTGFNAGSGGKKTSMSGTWSSNKNLSSKLWFYGLACYQPQFTYSSISVANAVYPVGVSNIKAGTPYPLISKWIPGGSGNGSGNYTGNMSNDDSFTQCVQSHTDLSVVKTISNSTPTVGSNVTFTLTATNNGPDNATLVVINDVLPSGYTLVSTTPSAGTWSTPNWAIGSLSNGASKTLTIVARVNPTGLYTNTATISGAEIDPVSSNNTSTITPAPKCVAPVLSLASGTYNTSQSVTLSTTTSGAIIKYTTDGSTPSQSNGTVYTNAVNVGSTSTLKAIAYKSGLTDSDVSSEVYTIQLLSVADPAFSPAAGTYSAAKSIAISTLTPGASIRYTTDGSIPSDVNGILYSVPVSVAQNTVLKAIAYKTNMLNSNVVSGNYAIKCVSPVMSTPTGTYNTSQSVILSTTTSGATIKYTTDGSTPSQSNGTVYTGAVNVGSTSTLKAIAYKSGLTDSDPSNAFYTITNDLDGDGITDRNDDYPNDSTRAFNNYFPSNGFGTLAFEDSWPDKGDQDLNDVVVDYRFKNVLNANNKLVETYAIFVLKASGAIYNNGFGFQLSNMIISSSDLNVVGSQIKSKYITLNSNGTEANQKKPTIIVFDNVFSTLQYPGVGVGVNTTIGLPYVAPDTISIHITYPANKYSEEQLDIAHFNPFIIVNKERGREVHLPDYAPTSLAKLNYFGTKDDNSIEAQNRYYKTNKNLSWALNIYDNFNYPVERAPINEVYTHFVDWVLSSGNLYPDWYKDLPGYRNSNKIFTHQVQ